MSRNLFWPILIIISSFFAAVFAGTNTGGILRPLILFWFILVCPGMAIIRLLRLQDPLAELVLAVALSLVMSTLFAEVMVLTRLWLPSVGLAILIGISLSGALLQLKYVRPRGVIKGQVHE